MVALNTHPGWGSFGSGMKKPAEDFSGAGAVY